MNKKGKKISDKGLENIKIPWKEINSQLKS